MNTRILVVEGNLSADLYRTIVASLAESVAICVVRGSEPLPKLDLDSFPSPMQAYKPTPSAIITRPWPEQKRRKLKGYQR